MNTKSVVEERSIELLAIYTQYFTGYGKSIARQEKRIFDEWTGPATGEPDEAIFNTLRKNDHSGKITRLLDGDTSDYKSPSEADFAMIRLLERQIGSDRERLYDLIWETGLKRDKWNEKRGPRTWIEYSINKLLRVVSLERNSTKESVNFDSENADDFLVGEYEALPAEGTTDISDSSIFDFTRFNEIGEFVDQPQLIKNLIPLGAKVMVFGPSNSGKSFLVVSMGMAIAQGIHWAGRKTEKAFVFYVVAEGGAAFMNRLLAYRSDYPDIAQDIPFGYITDMVNLFSRDDSFQKIKNTIDAVYDGCLPLVIVFDTLAMSMAGGKENEAADMTMVLGSVSELQKLYDATVLLVHHPGKDKSKGERGHSSLRAAVDTSLVISARDDNKNPRSLSASKQRDIDPGKPIEFDLKTVTIGYDVDGDAVTSCVVELHDAILDGLPNLEDPLANLGGVARRAFRAILSAESTLFKPLDDNKWHVTNGKISLAVSESELKTFLRKSKITDSDKPDSINKAVSRSITTLVDNNLLSSSVSEGVTYFWLTQRDG